MILLMACVATETPLVAVTETDTDGGRYHLLLSPAPDPPTVGEAALSIDLTDEAGEVVQDALVAVSAWMPDHGHGLSDAPITTSQGEGTYDSSWIYSMAGYWELTITVDADSGEDEVVVGYEVE